MVYMQPVLTGPSDWSEEGHREKAVSKSAGMLRGVPSVMTSGATLMLQWSALSWDMLGMVKH